MKSCEKVIRCSTPSSGCAKITSKKLQLKDLKLTQSKER